MAGVALASAVAAASGSGGSFAGSHTAFQTSSDATTITEQILDFLRNPTVAYVFLSLGMLGIFFEFSNPGGLLAGITGVILLALGLYGLHFQDVTWLGVGLMAIAFLLFLGDVFLPSAGLITAAGVVAFVSGSYMLIDDSAPEQISRFAIWAITACLAGFFLLMGALALKTRFSRAKVGKEGLIGVIGVVRQTLAPSGMVFAQGELWSATLDESTGHHELEQGKSVVVTSLDGLRLIVRPATETEQRQGASVAVPPVGRPEPV